MNKYLIHIVERNTVLLTTLPAELLEYADSAEFGYKNVFSQELKRNIKQIKQQLENGYIFLLTSDQNITRKILQHYYESLVLLHSAFKKKLNDLESSSTTDIRRLQHNITDYNAAIRDDLSSLLNFEDFHQDWTNALNRVTNSVKEDPKKAALILLKTHKNSTLIQAEMTVHDLMSDQSPRLEIFSHPIHKVVKLSFQPYFLEFIENNIHLHWSDCYDKVLIDYPSISVVLGHLWNNAIKYTKKNTIISIDFEVTVETVSVVIKMNSLYVEETERNSIFDEGVSGKWAKLQNLSGHGIGMFYIKKLVELNEGSFVFKAGNEKIFENGIPYSWNAMRLTLKRDL